MESFSLAVIYHRDRWKVIRLDPTVKKWISVSHKQKQSKSFNTPPLELYRDELLLFSRTEYWRHLCFKLTQYAFSKGLTSSMSSPPNTKQHYNHYSRVQGPVR